MIFGDAMKEITINVAQIVGGGICVAASDGHKVHDAIRGGILAKNRVRLSFSGVSRITTAFLNTAVGQLYNEFSEEVVRRHLAPPIDATPLQLSRLKMVVDRAKQYFKNPGEMDHIFRTVTGIDDA